MGWMGWMCSMGVAGATDLDGIDGIAAAALDVEVGGGDSLDEREANTVGMDR